MEIAFHDAAQYAAFFDPKARLVTLVSDAAVEAGAACTPCDGLEIAVASDDELCHLMLSIEAEHERSVEAPPQAAVRADYARVGLPAAPPTWALDRAAGRFVLEWPGAAQEWGRIGDSGVALALTTGGELVRLVCDDVLVDSGGGQQASWLERAGR